jgi:polyhydroxyalkanoate synthesis regulator phasin
MTAVPFDTLKLADRLQAGGFSAEQSRTFASALADAVSGSEIATKQDLANLATKADLQATNAEVQAVKADVQILKADLQAMRAEFRTGLSDTKSDILKWIVSTIGVQTVAILGVVVALMRLMH